MAIQLIETTELEPRVTSLNFRGTPISAKGDFSPEQLWNHYHSLLQQNPCEVEISVEKSHVDINLPWD